MKTKEEILKEFITNDYLRGNFTADSNQTFTTPECLSSMETYADQFKQQWVPVSEKKPQDGKDLLITNKEDGWVSIGYFSESYQNWFNTYDHECPCYPTHYTSLPASPIDI